MSPKSPEIERSGILFKQQRLKTVRPVLHHWIQCVSRYCSVADDAPYWYNERASLSTFAAAAWEAGGVAVEEYATYKGRRKAGPPNRVDLWFCYRRRSFVVEAKTAWPHLGPGHRLTSSVERVKQSLNAALVGVQEYPKEGTHLGVTFVAPSLPAKQLGFTHVAALVGPLLNELVRLDHGFVSWVFPIAAREFIGDDGRHYPGVIAIGRLPSSGLK